MTYYVYILRCRNGTYYVGHTANLEKRLEAHSNGHGSYHTKTLAPFQLVYQEKHDSKTAAVKRELQIKKWSRVKKEALISGDIETLRKLSRKQF